MQKKNTFIQLCLLLVCFIISLAVTLVLGNKCRKAHLNILVMVDQSATLEIYYDIGNGFQDEGHQVCALPSDDTFLVRFFVPDHPVKRIRLIPSTAMQIQEMRLVNTHDALIRTIPIEQLTASGPGADGVALDYDAPLGNTYGFRPTFFVVLSSILYFLLWLCTQVVTRTFKFGTMPRLGEKHTAQKWTGWRLMQAMFVVSGALWFIGGVFLWSAEYWYLQKQDDQGSHALKPYTDIGSVQKRNISLVRALDGVRIACRIYSSDTTPPRGDAIVLLHGNYPDGSRYPLYHVLANELAHKGYLVLSLDFAGFGRSGDSLATNLPESLNLDLDVQTALDYLTSQDRISSNRIHLIGHSMGAEPALSVGSKSDVVNSIVLIGPPRRVYQRFNYEPDVDFFWDWKRKGRQQIYGTTSMPDWFSKEKWRRQRLKQNIVHFLPMLSRQPHKPIFFIDGELEQGPDRRYLRWYYCLVSWPKRFLSLAKANHDCNLRGEKGKIVYDRTTMKQLVQALDHWFAETESSSVRLADQALNILRNAFAIDMLRGC